jgi:hypothetical protein
MPGHPKTRIGQVNQSSGVIRVEVCQYDLSDISGADPEFPELGTNPWKKLLGFRGCQHNKSFVDTSILLSIPYPSNDRNCKGVES